MKKMLLTILCLGLMFNNLALCEEQNAIKISITNIALQSPIKNSYTAFRVTFINTTKNPIRIEDLKFFNKIDDAKFGDDALKLSKGETIGLVLSPLTLGVSAYPALLHSMNNSNKITTSINEMKRYHAYYTTNTDTPKSGTLIFPYQSMSFEFLTNINEQPYFEGLFHDIITNQFITINNGGI